jgi:hypothetical protein
MMNTYGTFLRIVVLAMLLCWGWFAMAAAAYAAVAWSLGFTFEWSAVFVVLAAIMLLRMFVPRNVFR